MLAASLPSHPKIIPFLRNKHISCQSNYNATIRDYLSPPGRQCGGRRLVLQPFQPCVIGVFSSFKITVFKVNSTAVSLPDLHPDLED